MRLATPLLALALTAAMPLHAATADLAPPQMSEPVYATTVDSMIEIGADGSIVKYEPITALKEPLATRVRTLAEALRFEPVLVDGKPVIARTRARLHLVAKPAEAGSLLVSVEDVGFPNEDGGTRGAAGSDENPYIHGIAQRARIAYPMNALRAGLSGRVMVAMRLAPDGSVIDAIPRESALYSMKGADARMSRALSVLERAAVDAIKRWRFDVRVPEGAYPKPEDLTAAINVEYVIDDHPVAKQGLWLYEARSQERAPTWLEPAVAEQLPDMNDIGEAGHFGATPSRFKLVTRLGSAAL